MSLGVSSKNFARFAACAFVAAWGWTLRAESQAVRLSQDLSYLRLSALPADLPPGEAAPKGALVIDIRGAAADRSGTTAFSAWLGLRGNGEYPTYILANQDTAPSLKKALLSANCPALITLAPSGADFEADIAVDTSAEADRTAYAALVKGSSLDSLLSMSLEKERLDEAKLAKDYENGLRSPGRDPALPPKGEKAQTGDDKTKPSDIVLARAVQIHRALEVLQKKL